MLKTDYKDDVFEKNRMYQTVDNKDGTFCLIDVTEYSQEGDAFGAKDINATNEAINQILSLIHISEPTRPRLISYAVFCLKKKN